MAGVERTAVEEAWTGPRPVGSPSPPYKGKGGIFQKAKKMFGRREKKAPKYTQKRPKGRKTTPQAGKPSGKMMLGQSETIVGRFRRRGLNIKAHTPGERRGLLFFGVSGARKGDFDYFAPQIAQHASKVYKGANVTSRQRRNRNGFDVRVEYL